MIRRTFVAALMVGAVAVLLSGTAIAAALTTLVGEIQSVAASTDAFELKTAKATVTIKLTAETTYVLDGKPATKSLLKAGNRVSVTTSKEKSGDLVAVRVVGLGAAKTGTAQ